MSYERWLHSLLMGPTIHRTERNMANFAVTATQRIEGQGKSAIKTPLDPPIQATFEYDRGTDLASAIALHGEATVFSFYYKGATVALQNVARTQLEHGASEEAIQNALNLYKLGVAAPRVAKSITEQDALSLFAAMAPEAQVAFIKSLRERAAGR